MYLLDLQILHKTCVLHTIVGSLGLLPVILSGIKCCDSQQGESVTSMGKLSERACMGNNSITQTTHKTMQYIIAHVIKLSWLSLCVLHSMRQKAGEELGNEANVPCI